MPWQQKNSDIDIEFLVLSDYKVVRIFFLIFVFSELIQKRMEKFYLNLLLTPCTDNLALSHIK